MPVLRRRSVAWLAALFLATATASAAPPGPPPFGGWEDRDPLDDAVRPLADLNLRPEFSLSTDQKTRIQAVRDAFTTKRMVWRTAHAAELQKLTDRWSAAWQARRPGGPPSTRPVDDFHTLQQESAALRLTAPDPTDPADRIKAVLTPAQRRQFDSWVDHGTVDVAMPTAAFGSETLPTPADGVPKEPGFYKLRADVKLPGDRNGDRGGTVSMRMTYILFLPKGYDPAKGPYPTLVFLHGSGEVGTDGNALFNSDLGPAAAIRHRAGTTFATDFPMVLVCPQCPPRGERWDQQAAVRGALGVLDEAERKVRVDPDRVYATGLSMGGKGTWVMAGLAPDRFAAIAPISASTLDLPLAAKLTRTAVRSINGQYDFEQGADHMRQMAAAVRAAGGDAVAEVVPDQTHYVWGPYYDDPKFYQWFLTHRRGATTTRPAR